jgi:hypothetical protein
MISKRVLLSSFIVFAALGFGGVAASLPRKPFNEFTITERLSPAAISVKKRLFAAVGCKTVLRIKAVL